MVLSMNTRTLSFALGAVCIIPIGGTLYRLAEIVLTGHWAFDFNPAHVDRLPLFLHCLAMITFLVLGAFQLSNKFRVNSPKRHRILGRIAGFGAIIGGLTGVWMTLLHLEISTPLLLAGRLLFGSAMALFIVFAIRAAIRRDFRTHRAWVIRSYAIALNAGTLGLIYLPVVIIFGEATPLVEDAIQVAGWMINLAVAERFFINRPIRYGVTA